MDAREPLDSVADTALRTAVRFWFLVTVIGQLLFAFYVATSYGGAAVRGDFAGWNRHMPLAHIPGETLGNFAVAMHLLLGVMVILGGALQLLPHIRDRVPRFHRWNGTIYLLNASAVSIAALYMVWIRGSVGNSVQRMGISINAVLILIFAALALRYAIARRFSIHRRWALRLFIAVSGVWFFRVGLMLWVFLNRDPGGFDPIAFQHQWAASPGGTSELAPVLTFLSFAQYVVPLAVLELYLRTKNGGGMMSRIAMAALLFVLTLATGVGVYAATVGMWLPQIGSSG